MSNFSDFKEDLPVKILVVIVLSALAFWIFSPSEPKEPVKVDPRSVVDTRMSTQDQQMAVLMTVIEKTARDPSSIQFGKQTRYSDAVCVQANGKNGFGGYTGFKEYCSVTQKDGTKKFTIDGELQK